LQILVCERGQIKWLAQSEIDRLVATSKELDDELAKAFA
jgi:hypothetical protein